jgi:transcriptional regulator with XRE-family HTH domain
MQYGTIHQRVGRALKLCRVKNGDLTLDETADKIEAVYGSRPNKATISTWERGRVSISIEVLDAYAKTFKTTIVRILQDAGLDEEAAA